MNIKLHAVADANGQPLSFFMTAGQVSDYTGAAALPYGFLLRRPLAAMVIFWLRSTSPDPRSLHYLEGRC
jgi:hypothetical protein